LKFADVHHQYFYILVTVHSVKSRDIFSVKKTIISVKTKL